ncbi:hypothetical protein [Streptomyces sp. NPDC001787]|uniref:hypothetical protein n=1 Tax=Streptomyces sp. NPDC001787 TaxID=3154523 RepID=UPI00332DC245
METAYEKELRDAVAEVQACKSIQTKRYERGPLAIYLKCADDAFEIMRMVQDVPSTAGLEESFHRYSNLSFAWRALEPYDMIAGEFRISHMAEAVVRGPQPSAFDPATSETGRLVEEFRIFETHPVGGTGTYTALRLAHGEDFPEIWYFDIRQGPTRLHISYGDYLKVMLRTRGLYHWQYLFAEPDKENCGMSVSLPYLRDGLDFLSREFPGDDLSDLGDRLAERTFVRDEG